MDEDGKCHRANDCYVNGILLEAKREHLLVDPFLCILASLYNLNFMAKYPMRHCFFIFLGLMEVVSWIVGSTLKPERQKGSLIDI